MTDWAVIGIITTMIMMSMMIIGVLITMFIYLIRRMDAMRREFSIRIQGSTARCQCGAARCQCGAARCQRIGGARGAS